MKCYSGADLFFIVMYVIYVALYLSDKRRSSYEKQENNNTEEYVYNGESMRTSWSASRPKNFAYEETDIAEFLRKLY